MPLHLPEGFTGAIMRQASESAKEQEKEIRCKWCGKVFDTKQKRNNHIKEQHPNKWRKK